MLTFLFKIKFIGFSNICSFCFQFFILDFSIYFLDLYKPKKEKSSLKSQKKECCWVLKL